MHRLAFTAAPRRPSGNRSGCLSTAIRAAFLALLAALVLGGAPAAAQPADGERAASATVAAAALPAEAREVLERIAQGGPFAYKRDGIVFGNFEKQLPARKKGWYHEYTVPTPGAKNRGARRIITGHDGELYYTDDHYSTFRRIIQ